MNDRKFVNQFQPQTLVIATLLLYINAVFLVITFYPPFLLVAVGMAFGGFGIANEKRWGYTLGVVAAVINVVAFLVLWGSDAFRFPGILSLFFDGALVGLLVHPMSREYQRIWFK